ncbi:hypothetical protein Tco_1002461 [Tanacetum coccineum]|uniref:Uncharacterized protein n=1 Tax=Tanacetum coccineum TaxID=301880 RepID=A0ABQ5F7P9_9ASTR
MSASIKSTAIAASHRSLDPIPTTVPADGPATTKVIGQPDSYENTSPRDMPPSKRFILKLLPTGCESAVLEPVRIRALNASEHEDDTFIEESQLEGQSTMHMFPARKAKDALTDRVSECKLPTFTSEQVWPTPNVENVKRGATVHAIQRVVPCQDQPNNNNTNKAWRHSYENVVTLVYRKEKCPKLKSRGNSIGELATAQGMGVCLALRPTRSANAKATRVRGKPDLKRGRCHSQIDYDQPTIPVEEFANRTTEDRAFRTRVYSSPIGMADLHHGNSGEALQLAMSSDNASSAVTYTSISSDSNGLSWGIPLVNVGELPEMNPYEEVAQQGQAPPLSPAYVEDQPYSDDASPTAESPGHIADSESMKEDSIDYPDEPEDDDEDPEEDPKEDHTDDLADGEDGDDEPSDDDDDDDDTNDEDEEPTEDEEEDEHLAPADTSTVLVVDPIHLDHLRLGPAYDQAPLGHRATMIRIRDDVPKEDMPPRRRFVLSAPPPGCDVAESSSAAAARPPRGQYDFVDTVKAVHGLIRSPGHDAWTIARAADRAEDAG